MVHNVILSYTAEASDKHLGLTGLVAVIMEEYAIHLVSGF